MKRVLSSSESEDLINTVSDIATWSISPSGKVWWSKGLYKIYGMRVGDDVSVEGFKSKVFPEDYSLFEKTINEAVKTKKNFQVKARIFIGKSYCWVDIKGRVTENGTILGTTQNIDKYYREFHDLKLQMDVIRVLSLNKDSSVEKIHNILYDV